MENKYNYTIVGAFVVGFLAIFISLIVWLTIGTEKIKTIPYRVVTGESVSGLSINSSVDYRGVDVGKVASIELNKRDPRYVNIMLNIKEGTPIKVDTKAILISKGVTGLVSVSLTDGTPKAEALLPTKEKPIPKIKNGASLFKRLDEAFSSITTSILGLSDQLNRVLTTENTDNIAKMLVNAELITKNLADSSADIKNIVSTTSTLVTEAKPKVETVLNSLDRFGDITTDVKNASQQLDAFLKSYTTLSDDWSKTSVEWTELATSTQKVIPNIGAIARELRTTLNSLSALVQELQQQPNALIMGKESGRKGPGE